MKLTDEELASLLSGRDEPSVLAKEALFERVLARAAVPARNAWALRTGVAAGFLAAAAGVALVVGKFGGPDELVARGGAGGPSVEVVCAEGGATGRCAAPGTVAFDVTAMPEMPYFAAFARATDGTIVWFFPASGGTSERVVATGKASLLDRGIRLGDSLPPGKYEVFAVFSSAPLGRDALKVRLGDELRGDAELAVVRRPLIVEGAR